MKRLRFLFLLAMASALAGCANSYMMRLSNGSKIISANKPKLQNGYYMYKDARGEKHYISQARVFEIAPASMTENESGPPKKK